MAQRVERKLTTILCADVEGYSRLMAADEEATLATLTAYREIIDALIAKFRGRIFSTAGDSVVAEFPSPVEAVRCAAEIQRQLGARNDDLPQARRMRFRIGINLGDVMVKGDDLLGDGVNVAARLEGLAEPGGICLSGPVHEQVRSKLDLDFENLGARKVKNIAEPVHVFRAHAGGGHRTATSVKAWRRPDWLGGHAVRGLAVVVVLLLAWQVLWPDDKSMPLPSKPSIPVLPFDNHSGDPKQDYFSDGITEDIITELSRFSELFVIARNSSFTYKGKAVKVQQISRELGVRYVLEGSVRRAGQRIRINAQLIDATTGHHLWAERYDRGVEDVFTIQDEITQRIVAALAIEVGAAELRRVKRKGRRNMEAYDYALRARYYQTTHSTRESNLKARRLYEKAIARDPNYAPFYANMAWTYMIAARLGWSKDRRADSAKGFERAQTAASLDDTVSKAHLALADAFLWRKQYDRALSEVRLAIKLNPNDPDAYATYGDVLTWSGEPDAGIVQINKARRLNPMNPFFYTWYLGHAYFLLGRYDDAIDTLTQLSDVNPDFWPAQLYVAASLSHLGRIDEAKSLVTRAMLANPRLRESYDMDALPYKNPADRKRLFDGLAKAGLAH